MQAGLFESSYLFYTVDLAGLSYFFSLFSLCLEEVGRGGGAYVGSRVLGRAGVSYEGCQEHCA